MKTSGQKSHMSTRNSFGQAAGRVQRLRDWVYLFRRWRGATEPLAREHYGLALLERLRERLVPSYMLGDFSKTWSDSRDMSRLAERRFVLGQFALALADLPGDTAEAGVYDGTSSRIICGALSRPHHAFDSFEGLSEPTQADGYYWHAGDLTVSEPEVRESLERLGARVYRGWIPEVFREAAIKSLCLAHVDVDLYEPTRDSFAFFYPLLTPGGVLICDDYGFATCPGARRAVDEFMTDKPERVIHLPTGQGLISSEPFLSC
jgi:O-methyltransferase